MDVPLARLARPMMKRQRKTLRRVRITRHVPIVRRVVGDAIGARSMKHVMPLDRYTGVPRV